MSKKDFQAIARALHSIMPPRAEGSQDTSENIQRRDMWEDCVDSIANVCATDNPRFDRARFLAACETGHDTGCKCPECKEDGAR